MSYRSWVHLNPLPDQAPEFLLLYTARRVQACSLITTPSTVKETGSVYMLKIIPFKSRACLGIGNVGNTVFRCSGLTCDNESISCMRATS